MKASCHTEGSLMFQLWYYNFFSFSYLTNISMTANRTLLVHMAAQLNCAGKW